MAIRAWIAYRRGVADEADSALDVLDVPSGISGESHGGGSSPQDAMFAGGRSGGGGGGATWGKSSVSESAALNVDADELWPVVLAAACAIGALFALIYVVWAAPLLLAEVAVDAALVTGVYRKLRRQDTRHWLHSALQRTWFPALATGAFMMAAGFALQWAAPGAQSIGSALRVLLSRS